MGETKKGKAKPDTTNWTKPSQFRFTAETLAEIDSLMARLGVGTRSDAIRIAIRMTNRKLDREEK